jgi:hypothetical protein
MIVRVLQQRTVDAVQGGRQRVLINVNRRAGPWR